MAMKEYVVVVDGVSVETGGKTPSGKPEVVRVLNGHRINSDDKDPKILQLLEFRSVVPADKYKPGMRVTPKIVVAALGAKDDPVRPLDKDVQPVPAPLGTTLD
ncbi:MAG: hypothetical protein ACM3UO_00215 [Bacillota bacterium]